MKKIVYCHTSLRVPAGMERVLTTKVNYWAGCGHSVHVILQAGKHQPCFSLDERVQLHFLDAGKSYDYRNKLERLLMIIRPDYTVSMFGCEAAFLPSFKDGSKKILEFHFSRYYLSHLVRGIPKLRFRWLHLLRAKYNEWREAVIIRKYETVVVLTEKDKMLWGSPSNMVAIPNPLSFTSDKKSNYRNRKIVAMGRYIAQKGFDLLIEAFSKIASAHPEWCLEIYGEGQDKNNLQGMIEDYNLANQVSLLPPVKDVQSVMCSADFFVFPSRYEGFGLVLTEAMECGLPCVAFDCECGPSDIVEDGISGKLVAEGNVNALAESMSMLMGNLTLTSEMGYNARKCVKRFYLQHIMKRWENIFR